MTPAIFKPAFFASASARHILHIKGWGFGRWKDTLVEKIVCQMTEIFLLFLPRTVAGMDLKALLCLQGTDFSFIRRRLEFGHGVPFFLLSLVKVRLLRKARFLQFTGHLRKHPCNI